MRGLGMVKDFPHNLQWQFAFFMQDGFMFRQVLNLQKAYGKPCSRTIYLCDPPREKSDDVGQQMFLCNEDKDTGLH